MFTHLVCPISGLEIDGGGPVIGQILIELAAGAARNLGDVGHGHGGVEGVLGEVSTRTVVRGGGKNGTGVGDVLLRQPDAHAVMGPCQDRRVCI